MASYIRANKHLLVFLTVNPAAAKGNTSIRIFQKCVQNHIFILNVQQVEGFKSFLTGHKLFLFVGTNHYKSTYTSCHGSECSMKRNLHVHVNHVSLHCVWAESGWCPRVTFLCIQAVCTEGLNCHADVLWPALLCPLQWVLTHMGNIIAVLNVESFLTKTRRQLVASLDMAPWPVHLCCSGLYFLHWQ